MDDGLAAAVDRAVVTAGLARVDADHPAAVLLVDLDSGDVVYANALAAQLAPNVRLPTDVGAWSRAAGLQDGGGQPLDDTATPLNRVATGNPVRGEHVTARRGSDVSAARESLWVVGMPLVDAPAPLDRRALVVFLPLRDHEGVDQIVQAGRDLQHRAVVSSEVSFSISDPHAPDDPLVWVNPAFESITGYRGVDVVGTNCRFLQGPHTDPAAVARIRAGLAAGGTVSETLLNYRADGTAFWNHIVISPVYDADGVLSHHVGVQSDITERVDADAARDRALAAARAANARLTALAAVSAELTDTVVTAEATLDRLPGAVADHFPGWVLACELASARRGVTRVRVAHSDPVHAATARDLAARATAWADTSEGRHTLDAITSRISDGLPLQVAFDAEQVTTFAAVLGVSDDDLSSGNGVAVVVAPLTARDTRVGVVALVRDGGGGFDAEELSAVADLGVRAGVAVDNARLYAGEHDAALTLQRSLLPQVPRIDGYDVAAVHQPAHDLAQVGGDWYDVLVLPDGGVAVTVGDVMGHDLRAAATMGQLRSVLRTLAWSGDSPDVAMTRFDELVRGLEMAAFATCVFGVVRTGPSGPGSITYTSAGHPPPALRHVDGRIELLDQALTSPVGVAGDTRPVPQATAELPPGAHLVFYTDGLVERRGRDITTSLDALSAALAAAPVDLSAAQMCERLVEVLTADDHDDDICVLVLRRL